MKIRSMLARAMALALSCSVAVAQTNQGGSPMTIIKGGTGATTAAGARSSLKVDQYTPHGNSNYPILPTDRTVGTSAAFTASRTWTLPAANSVNPGHEIIVADFQGTVTGTNTLVIARSGSDIINSVATSVTISAANGGYLLRSDGVSRWTAQAFTAGTGITSVTCGTGLSGGTFTTSGTCALALTNAFTQVSLGDPTGTISPTAVMMGLGGTCKITLIYSGRVEVEITGSSQNSVNAATNTFTAYYGTGTAPANSVAPPAGSATIGPPRPTAQSGTTLLMPFKVGGIISGLSVGVPYWFDVSQATTTGTGSAKSVGCTLKEY